MLAASFITFDIGNIFLMIGGVLLFLVCVGAEILFAKDGGGNYQGAMALFSLFFLIGMGVVFPHMNSVDSRHHAQVTPDMTREYGVSQFTVIDNSVRDHWVEFRLKSCGASVYKYENMRRIRGHYWLAITVVQKDKYGQKHNHYRAISLQQLHSICQVATVVATT